MGFFNGDQKVKKVGYNQGGGQVPLPDVRVWAGDGFITGVAGGGDGTGVTPAPPADDVQHRWPPPLGAAVQQGRFLFCSNMSATQCRTLQMNLSYVTPSSPLTHRITGLLLPSCSFCIHRGLGLQSDSSITIEVPLSWGDPET